MPNFNLEDYVTVNERLEMFRKDHPLWGLEATVKFDGNAVLARAVITDETGRLIACGHAEEIRDVSPVNKTSAVENCETSAWGRALANLGYEVKRGVASREEMEKVQRAAARPRPKREPVLKQDQALAKQAADLGISEEDRVDVIRAITKGRTASGKDLEPAEVIWVATAYEELATGEVKLRRDPDGVVRIGRVVRAGGNNPGPPEPF